MLPIFFLIASKLSKLLLGTLSNALQALETLESILSRKFFYIPNEGVIA